MHGQFGCALAIEILLKYVELGYIHYTSEMCQYKLKIPSHLK